MIRLMVYGHKMTQVCYMDYTVELDRLSDSINNPWSKGRLNRESYRDASAYLGIPGMQAYSHPEPAGEGKR